MPKWGKFVQVVLGYGVTYRQEEELLAQASSELGLRSTLGMQESGSFEMKAERITRALLLAMLAGAISTELFSQTTERSHRASSKAPIEWSAEPARASVPEWARHGSIRFARWDGGRIEATKGILSGWPNFWPPDPNVLYATDHWYDLSTIQLLREAGINLIWVTFSNGFSNETEKLHQAEVARYIRECHRQGIHVLAYESISNMFWQDMFKNVPASRHWVLLDKDGKPTPYGAAAYDKVGYVSRYVADPSNTEWQAYLRGRVKLAVDAGADGIVYDNNVDDDVGLLMNLYRMINQYGASLKKDLLFMGNFHQSTYILNRVTNCMTTEDGVEPGIYSPEHAHSLDDPQYLLATDGGYLANNIGLLRLLFSLSQGWKPNLVEDGQLESGTREAQPMRAERRQLAMAEAMSFGAANALFVEDRLAEGLWNHEPGARSVWNAIAQYDRFFADHQAYYLGGRSAARLAVVLDDSSAGVQLLNGLAARNILYDVIYERDLTAGALARYPEVALLTADRISDRALATLEGYVQEGGKLFAAGKAARLDETGHERARPPFFGHKIGKGECVYFDQILPFDRLAENLRQFAGADLPELQAPAGVVYNVVAQPESHRLVIHLINYNPAPVANVGIRFTGKYQSAKLLSPDLSHEVPVTISRQPDHSSHVTVPRLKIYALVVLNQ